MILRITKFLFALILVYSCAESSDKKEFTFSKEEQITKNLYLGFNNEGKCMPFTIEVLSSGDTTKKFKLNNFYQIDFPENNKLYCYIKTSCDVPLRLSVYDLVKYNDQRLKRSIKAHNSKFSKYPREQQVFLTNLWQINDAIITEEDRQKRMEQVFKRDRSFTNWKFTLQTKKIKALWGAASWLDFTFEDFQFRYYIRNSVTEAFDHKLGDETYYSQVEYLEKHYNTYKIGQQYSLSGTIKADTYGYGIALKNPISLDLKHDIVSKEPLPLRSLSSQYLKDWIWFEGDKLVFYVDFDGTKMDIPLKDIHSMSYSTERNSGYTSIDIKINSESLGINYNFGDEYQLDKHLNEVKRFINETLIYVKSFQI